jgi:hypothetical protein
MSPLLGPYQYEPAENGLPPREARIVDLRGEPYPEDGHRIRVHIALTPFKEKPDLLVVLATLDGVEISSVNIIETIDDQMTLTMHIRTKTLENTYLLKAQVTYAETGIVDQKSIPIEASVKEE